MESNDGLAFIGLNPGPNKNIYIATGDSGNGITHGTLAGMILSDLIMGKKNDWILTYIVLVEQSLQVINNIESWRID